MSSEEPFSVKFLVGYAAAWIVCLAAFFSDVRAPRSVEEVLRIIPQPSWTVMSYFCLYVLLLAILSEVLPGSVTEGTKLADGSKLKYKTNGLLVCMTFLGGLTAGVYTGYIDGCYIADHIFEFWAAGSIFAFVLATYLFVVGRATRPVGSFTDRSLWDDYIMGAELNPHILGLDVKFFSYRPAMCGWLLINLSFVYKQYTMFGFVTKQMALYQIFTNYYVIDYLFFESKITTTWDIIAEHFGLMLIWGDYFLIPMGFSVQNFFLYNERKELSNGLLALAVAAFVLGLIIFRGANSQKHAFREDPSKPIWGRPPVTIGGKLLVSGFWGLTTHINYLGDLILALSFCLPCGSTSPRAYSYFFYLLLLLLHREQRDDMRCKQKYKDMWDKYRARVPYRILPYVY